MENSIYRAWVPKWMAIIWHMVLFVPLMSLGSVYSACSGDTIGSLQIWSEDFTFASLCAMIGIGVMAPFFYKIACYRRHHLTFLIGFGALFVISAASSRASDPLLLGLFSLVMGAIRFVLIVTNFAAFARCLLGVDFRHMLGPQGDAKSTKEWDDTEQKKSMMIPIANIFFMSVGQLGTWITAYYAYHYQWQDVYRLEMLILLVLMIGVIAMEKYRGWDERDESAVSEDDEPLIRDHRRPWSMKYMGNVTAASIAWCAAAYVLVYGKTLDWFHSPKITVACALFFVFLFANMLIDKNKSEDERYFRYEIWTYRNIRLATVLYCLAMVLNTSSSLTNAIASIGLSLDTYLNNMLANWAPLGYLIGAVTVIVLRSRGVAYKWVFAIGFGIFAWTMWFTYNQVQLQARYEDIRMLSIVRNCGMFMLYCICMVYAYQRLPYRLMPSWIHIMLISRSVIGPAIGAAIYGAGMQHYQHQFIHSLSAMSDNLRMVNLQAMLLAVKEMAGWTLWVCLAIVLVLLIIPWPKRHLKPAEIPEDFLINP